MSIHYTHPDLNVPRLTADIPGIGGTIKQHHHDFIVEEIPLYLPSDSGTHTYIFIEKKGMATSEAIALLARHLNRKPRDFGYAGQKDNYAVTRQWLSVEHLPEDALTSFSNPQLQILKTRQHTNKLRLGHLQGNQFNIRIRDLKIPFEEAQERTQPILAILKERGVPNYFGPQRFGARGTNHLLGQALLTNQREAFADLLLGSPLSADTEDITRARTLYDQGDYEGAAKAWPRSFKDEYRALRDMLRKKGNKARAVHVVDKTRKRFLASAFQSYLFNQVLAQRLPQFDQILSGDMAMKHENGACFQVEDPQTEQPRCQNLEISPTGPLIGPRMVALTDAAGAIENPILDPLRPILEKNSQPAHDLGRGGRRALRFIPRNIQQDCGQDEHGPYLQINFELDPGCYATTLLAEIMTP